ncbi:MAG: NAD-dependent deacetylase [Syntrophobacteraceae bacterium]
MSSNPVSDQLKTLRERLASARSIAVLTGAGISAESGVPTFRGADGLWRQYRAVDLATPEAFAKDPALVWEFYNWRRELLAPLAPNPGHYALVELERRASRFQLITQNVDGLHSLAGSRNVLELHGNIWRVRCTQCERIFEDRRVPLPPLPTCSTCGAMLRPHIVWFGETLDRGILTASYAALETCDVMLVVGTSGTVEPAASMGLYAREHGAFLAEVNLETTPYTQAYDLTVNGLSGEILPALVGQSA